MDAYYTAKANIIKALECFMLPIVFQLLSGLFDFENIYVSLLASLVPIGCLYTVPFRFSLRAVRTTRVERIGKYIALDALYCLVPVVMSLILTETVTVAYLDDAAGAGIYTITVSIVCVIISAVFWLMYYIYSRQKRK